MLFCRRRCGIAEALQIDTRSEAKTSLAGPPACSTFTGRFSQSTR
ncbi:hypothetical protein CLOSTMETH_02315 [[Clostridium] methylpentosum DSM 5476]|uniref:Uncharacterized protein n=1 Tax=[Clostridium] methylpentosum DSM 5476 TaxID=537013 RepID=C0EEM6_9FIRM|nr:hypothetical protein CLOSTMETH_02315 [[Clostridium] methylpentosum DSM 5476]